MFTVKLSFLLKSGTFGIQICVHCLVEEVPLEILIYQMPLYYSKGGAFENTDISVFKGTSYNSIYKCICYISLYIFAGPKRGRPT